MQKTISGFVNIFKLNFLSMCKLNRTYVKFSVFFLAVLTALVVPVSAYASPTQVCKDLFLSLETASVLLNESLLPSRESKMDYILRKMKEVPHLDKNYLLEVRIRQALLQLPQRNKKTVFVDQIFSIHPINDNRPSAQEKFLERKALVETHQDYLLAGNIITQKAVDQVLPSKNHIRVIQLDKNLFVIFDGNGRFKAIKEIIHNSDVKMQVEEWGPMNDHLKK